LIHPSLMDLKLSWHLWTIFQNYLFAYWFCYQHVSKINLTQVCTYIRIFPYCAQFKYALLLTLYLKNDSSYYDCCLCGGKFYTKVRIRISHKDTLRWADDKLCEFEEIIKRFCIWIKYGERKKWCFTHCTESQLTRFRDRYWNWFLKFRHYYFYNLCAS
jgi:hypothetical protein